MKTKNIVKIFSSNSGTWDLQRDINAWLSDNEETIHLEDVKYQDDGKYCSALIIYRGK